VRRALVVTAVVVSAVACGHGKGAAAIAVGNRADRFPQTAAVVLPFQADATPTAVHTGGEHPAPREWDAAAVSPSGRTLLVRYSRGACEWLDHVEASEGKDRVTVTVRVSTVPGTDVCVSSAFSEIVRVTLARPLRGRLVLDGAKNEPRPVVRLTREPPAA